MTTFWWLDFIAHRSKLSSSLFRESSTRSACLYAPPFGSLSPNSLLPSVERIKLTVHYKELYDIFEIWAKPGSASRKMQSRHAMRPAVTRPRKKVGKSGPLAVHLNVGMWNPICFVKILEAKYWRRVHVGNDPYLGFVDG
jgi:hypothetical protein